MKLICGIAQQRGRGARARGLRGAEGRLRGSARGQGGAGAGALPAPVPAPPAGEPCWSPRGVPVPMTASGHPQLPLRLALCVNPSRDPSGARRGPTYSSGPETAQQPLAEGEEAGTAGGSRPWGAGTLALRSPVLSMAWCRWALARGLSGLCPPAPSCPPPPWAWGVDLRDDLPPGGFQRGPSPEWTDLPTPRPRWSPSGQPEQARGSGPPGVPTCPRAC